MSNRQVAFTPYFTQNFKHLQKRYRRIGDDLNALINQLKGGDTPGDQVTGVGYPVYKARIKNSDTRRGKSGGYRVIYYLQSEEQIVMVTVYSKSDQSDIPAAAIRRIIVEYESQKPPNAG